MKNGNSMIIDPYGEVLSELKSFEDDITISRIIKDKIELSGGWRYTNARRPDLYRDIIGKDNKPKLQPIWMLSKN